jgi:hypothetical protein
MAFDYCTMGEMTHGIPGGSNAVAARIQFIALASFILPRAW